jgi:hypothetical protein
MPRRPRPKVHGKPAITITRTAYAASELVYIAYANRPYRYQHGDSRVVYIGTTKNGVWRVASSAVWKAKDVFEHWGFHTLEFYIIAAKRQGKQPTYRKLERALLLRFRERYGTPPVANKQGAKMRWRKDDNAFTFASLNKILDEFA